MANRCFWLSTTEVALHILTGGDCLQSHHNVRLFTRQLQWACQQCKRLLNHEGAAEVQQGEQLPVQALRIQIRVAEDEEEHSAGGTNAAPQPAGETPAGDEQPDGAEIEDMEVSCYTTTGTAGYWCWSVSFLWTHSSVSLLELIAVSRFWGCIDYWCTSGS